jgi:hypothetical protein
VCILGCKVKYVRTALRSASSLLYAPLGTQKAQCLLRHPACWMFTRALCDAAGETPRSNRKELKKTTTLFRLPSTCLGRLYLLHRENNYQERVKEGGQTGCGSWGGGRGLEPIITKAKSVGIFQYYPFHARYKRPHQDKYIRHCKKRLTIFPSPAGMSLTKLSLTGNNLIIAGQGEFGKVHSDWGREN